LDLVDIHFSDFEIIYSINFFENVATNLLSVVQFLAKNGLFTKIAKLNTHKQ